MARSVNTLAATARRGVEAKTGAIANMGLLGFRPAKYALTGEVRRWTTLGVKGHEDQPHWIVQRTARKTWRVIYCSGRMIMLKNVKSVPAEIRLGDGIEFPGPVAAAQWLQVERSNGNGTR
jgi:hypothetical protein